MNKHYLFFYFLSKCGIIIGCNKGGEVILVTEPEIIAVDEQQKLIKIANLMDNIRMVWM